MKAREIMTTDPAVVVQDDPISRAACLMRDREIGMVPVVRDLQSMLLAGVITDRDITIQHVADHCEEDCPVSAHMSDGGIATARADDDVSTVMDLMQSRQVRRIPVIDGNRRVVGVIAQADIATQRALPKAEVAQTVEKISAH